MDRALQAIILSQYRRKIAEKNKIHLKPVILMKSRKIDESREFKEQFLNKIKTLNKDDIEKMKRVKEVAVLQKAFNYFDKEKITLDNLIKKEMKEEFSEENFISVNSKEESEEKQITVNTLEDKNNPIRVIFAVDKLNEGWDVLNLFDNFRLYDTRDAGANVPGKRLSQRLNLSGGGRVIFLFRLITLQISI